MIFACQFTIRNCGAPQHRKHAHHVFAREYGGSVNWKMGSGTQSLTSCPANIFPQSLRHWSKDLQKNQATCFTVNRNSRGGMTLKVIFFRDNSRTQTRNKNYTRSMVWSTNDLILLINLNQITNGKTRKIHQFSSNNA